MPNKPLNYRQNLFVKYYTDGDTKGNQYQSAIKAGYTEKYATQACVFLLDNIRVKEAIVAETDLIEAERLDSRVFIDNQFKALLAQCLSKGDKTNAVRILENMAKNRGYYQADNEQQTENKALTEEQQALFDEYLAYRRRMLLKPAKEA